MTEPDEFDAFYRGTRDALLLQTYALTGDLPASSSAVRHAYVIAWHHWAKVSRVPEPEAWVRERAWGHAQRRHQARLWHRDRKLPPEERATLDALGKLSLTQRKLLVLNLLTSEGLAAMAREVALPRHLAEQTLQTATAQLALHRNVPTTHFRPLFEGLRAHIAGYRWPRSTILRRQGAARRRTHTLLGMVGAVAAVVGSGALVTDASGSRPTLLGGETAHHHRTGGAHGPALPPPPAFSADTLLTAGLVGGVAPGQGWSEQRTANNLSGDGVQLPCQQAAYADPRSRGALGRTFEAKGRGPWAGQLLEVSADAKHARRTYDSTVRWFAGCTVPRVQLTSTDRVSGVGDQAVLVVLRDWSRGATYLTGVARTGTVTSTTQLRLPTTGRVDPKVAARLMASSVNGVCGPLEGTCADKPALSATAPLPVGDTPALLLPLDLPPVATVHKPWAATEPRQAIDNLAATNCDHTTFRGKQVSHAVTRTYLIPHSGVADAFGLTETVGALREPAARAMLAGVRTKMGRCPDRDPGTDVTSIRDLRGPHREISGWRVRSELDNKHSVTYFMGVVRVGTAVAQVGFVPSGDAVLAPGDFVRLLDRTAERLRWLPRPG